MDITFEEVAFVIQDARYQQAIFDPDIPKPEKKFPSPGRDFKPTQFVEDNNIGLATVVYEPLGRFFLSMSVTPDEQNILNFAESICDLRRMDPSGFVQVADINALCDRYSVKLVPPGSSRNAPGGFKNEESNSQVVQVDTSQEETSIETVDSPRANSGALGTGAPGSIFAQPAHPVAAAESWKTIPAQPSVSVPVQQPPPPQTFPRSSSRVSEQEYDIEAKSQGEGGSRNLVTESIVTRFDERQVGDMTSPPPMSTYAANMSSVNTYGATVAAAISKKMALAMQHSNRSINLNRQVTDTIEIGLQPAYNRLIQDKRMWLAYLHIKWFSMQPVGDKQVRYHRVLGIGAFGTVNGCIVTSVGTMLAMKSMMKKRIKAKRAKSQVTAERDALEALAAHASPYCMRLRYAYETKEAYHLILPLAIGGDLKFHLKDGGFSHERARVYSAEVALGMGHIHSLGLIIRDLKPRNILLNSAGHCQISDFGLAVTISDGRTIRGRAGTEGYWSPEVINGLPYSVDADWWSFGCCLFEFISGISPFSCKHTNLKTRNEGTRKAEIRFPDTFDESAKSLVVGLLNRNVVERVGCRGGGVNEVLGDTWAYWKGFDMGAVRRNEMPAPWLPEKGHIYAASQGEIQENDDELETRKIKILPEDEIPFDPFIDFEDHQRDIIKVLQMQKKNNRISINPNGGGNDNFIENADGSGGGCCSLA